MTPRIKTASSVEQVIVRLRDEENFSFANIGRQIEMGRAAVSKVYHRAKNPPAPKKRGRPRKTDER